MATTSKTTRAMKKKKMANGDEVGKTDMSGKGEMAAHGADKNASKGGAISTMNAAATGPATNDAGDCSMNMATKPGNTARDSKMHPDTTASTLLENGGLEEATATSLMGNKGAPPPPAPPPAPTSAPAPVLGESFTADNGIFIIFIFNSFSLF